MFNLFVLLTFTIHAHQILFIYSRYCRTCLNILATLEQQSINITTIDLIKLTNQDYIILQQYNITQPIDIPLIYFHNNHTIFKYEYDVFASEFNYWITIFFRNQVPTIKTSIQELNEVQENICLYFGDMQYYDEFVTMAHTYPLYYFAYTNDSNVRNSLFLQNYTQESTYIVIRRKIDRYDNILQINASQDFQQQFSQFMNNHSIPYQQEYFTIKTMKFLQDNPKYRLCIYISPDLYQFQEFSKIFTQQVELYRQSNTQNNIIFIKTEPIFLAKKLLQRFLMKNIKEGPYMLLLQFNTFRFIMFEQQWNRQNIINWITNQIQYTNKNAVTYSQLVLSQSYLKMSYQEINSTTKVRIHSQVVLPTMMHNCQQQLDYCHIILIRVIPNCIDSFRLYAKILSLNIDSLNKQVTFIYAINTIIDELNINNQLSKNIYQLRINKNVFNSQELDSLGDITAQINDDYN